MMTNGPAAVAALAMAAQWIYKQMTAPQPLRDHDDGTGRYMDKTRYDRLCRFRVNHIHGEIPKEWALDANNCPQYEASFGENAQRLIDHVENIENSSYPLKLRVLGMVSHIAYLFQGLQRNKATLIGKIKEGTKELIGQYKGYRSDGFEALFFSDLAIWLSIELPRFSIHDMGTVTIVDNWILYCNDVLQKVLIFRGDNDAADNPRTVLSTLIEDLKGLKTDILKACKAASFNQKMHNIDATILATAKSMFDFFYLLLKDVPEKDFQVRSFLEQNKKLQEATVNGKDLQIQKLLGYQMGQWIVETLSKAGITSNSFENSSLINPELISKHLNSDFSKTLLDKTGMWQFVFNNHSGKNEVEKHAQVKKYLTSILDLHRLLLFVYYVRESVILGAKVSKNLGDAWVYGEDTGKEIVLALCEVILHSCNELCVKLRAFWHSFYEHDYTHYQQSFQHDNTDACYRSLTKAEDVVKRIEKYVDNIKKRLVEIKEAIYQYQREAKDIPEKICTLRQNLHTYVRLTNLPLEEHLQQDIIFSAKSKSLSQVLEIKHYVFLDSLSSSPKQTYEKRDLPYFMAIQNELDGIGKLPSSPSKGNFEIDHGMLYSNIQKNIYYEYLVKNQDAALSAGSRVYALLYATHSEALLLYSRMQAIFCLLYGLTDKPGLPARPTDVEIILIDILLTRAITEDFIRNKYFPFHEDLLPLPVNIKLTETQIEIALKWDWHEGMRKALFFDVQLPFIYELQVTNSVLAKQLDAKSKELERANEQLQTYRRLSVASSGAPTPVIRGDSGLAVSEKDDEAMSQISSRSGVSGGTPSKGGMFARISSAIMPTKQSVFKFPLTLRTLPVGSPLVTSSAQNDPILYRQGNQYYVYGKNNDSWGTTQLDANVVQALALPFPRFNESTVMEYEKKYKTLYVEIQSKKAHTAASSSKLNSGSKVHPSG